MRAFDLIQFIEKSGLDNSGFHAFEYNGASEGSQVVFVRRYFGADFTAGLLASGAKYVAFWGVRPKFIPDAILTSEEQGKIYVYRVTL